MLTTTSMHAINKTDLLIRRWCIPVLLLLNALFFGSILYLYINTLTGPL